MKDERMQNVNCKMQIVKWQAMLGRRRSSSLLFLCVLRVSVVNFLP